MPLKVPGLDGREATESPQKLTEALRIKLKEELALCLCSERTFDMSYEQKPKSCLVLL